MTTTEVSGADHPSSPDAASRRVLSRWPPGRVFHLALALPALAFLWSYTVPGFTVLIWFAVWLLLLGAVVWGVRLLAYGIATRRRSADGRAFRFLVAPAAGLVVLVLAVTDVPLRARWAVSRSHFETVVDEAMKDEDYESIETRSLGLYDVIQVDRRDEAVIFYESNGGFGDGDAGFAYLPDGPSPELENSLFEGPEFRHLGGPWYAWSERL